jgi:hypothetical protein
MHVEDIVGRDGRTAGQPVRLRDDDRVGDEPEGRATARLAVQLEEEQVVAPGEQADPVGGDALLADGAAGAVEERAKVILRTHSAGVYRFEAFGGEIGGVLSLIPPGGMIA